MAATGGGVRWAYCPEYRSCLDTAADEAWTGFTCEHCEVFQGAPPAQTFAVQDHVSPATADALRTSARTAGDGVETCAVCARHATTRGLCPRHYQAWRRAANADHDITMPEWITDQLGNSGKNRASSTKGPGQLCRIKGCVGPVWSRGLCRRHYLRRRRQLERINQHRTTTEPIPCCTQS